MVYGMWHSASGLQTQLYKQDVISNNLANVDTPGYKPDRIVFAERLNAAMMGAPQSLRHPILDAQTGGVNESPVYTNFESGNLIPSSNPLDVAIEGDGFLTVRTSDGLHYTRDGRMSLGADGALRHIASGGAMVDEDGTPIRLDPRAGTDVKISATGVLRQGETVAGRLAIVDFADRQKLEKTGENLFAADPLSAVKSQSQVRQSCYESSGVEPMSSLVEMMAATRAYQMNASMLSMQDETLQRVVNDVGRIG